MLAFAAAALIAAPQVDTGRWLEMIRNGQPAPACAAAESAGPGDPEAMRIAAWCYDTGTGVAKDQARAAALYLRAAQAGNSEAQWRYGVMLDTGEGGVARDPASALDWFHKAARQGNTNAFVSLGVMYSNGRGVAVDHEKALAAYLEAARRGNREALWHVGVIHFQGEGVTADRVEGAAWVIASSWGGSATARQIAPRALVALTPADRLQASRRAADIAREHDIHPPAPGAATN